MHRQYLRDRLIHLFENSINDVSIYFSIDVIELICADLQEKQAFQKDPSNFLNDLLKHMQLSLAEKLLDSEDLTPSQKLQYSRRLENTHIMFSCVPYTPKLYKQFSSIESIDVGKWVVLTGTVIQSSSKKTLDKSKIFYCKQCGHEYRLRTTFENHYQFEMPPQCTNMVFKDKSDSFFSKFFFYAKKSKKQEKSKEEGKNVKQRQKQKCGNKSFEPNEMGKICLDYQELRMQEQFQYISSGRIPQTVIVIIEGDFQNVEYFRAGDDLTITGLLSSRFVRLKNESYLSPQLVLYANHIALQKSQKSMFEDDLNQIESIYESQSLRTSQLCLASQRLSQKEMTISKEIQYRNQIISSFCPNIYGREMVKLGLLLSLIGGVSIENQNSKLRGNSHVLLVGEPGTGKSVLLKEAAKISERSFFTNAIGTTSAGLSVSHFKSGNEWMAEAGALVLADNGICCIDELTLLSKNDEKSLLQCMQQQTISSAKASVLSKFNARTTVISACNPIRPGQKYDDDLDLEANTGLSIPLLTRFDMIFILKDQNDLEEDTQKCDFILSNFMKTNEKSIYAEKKGRVEKINVKTLIKNAKEYSPELSNHEIFSTYYTEERKRDSKVKTARTFESLCRIAEAHAKLMHRQETSQMDCLTAIMLTENKFVGNMEEYYEWMEQFNGKYNLHLQ